MHLLLLFSIVAVYLIVPLIKKDEKQARKCSVILMGILLFLFAAFRSPAVGIDVQSYFDDYLRISKSSWGEAFNNDYRDPVFVIFLKVISYILKDPQYMLVIIGAWLAFGFSYFIYNTKGNVLICFFLFICLRVFPFTLSGLRQALAMGFIFFATVFLMRKKYVKMIIFTILGALFHASALVFLIALIFIKLKKNIITIIFTISIILLNMISGNVLVESITRVLLSGRFDSYAQNAIGAEFSAGATLYIFVLFLVFICFFLNKIQMKDDNASLLFKLTCMGVMFFFIGEGFPNMFRIAYYFICCIFPLVSEAIEVAFKKDVRLIVCSVIVVLLTAQYIYFGPGAGIDEYVFFWRT